MQAVLSRLIDKIFAAPIDPLPSDNIYLDDVFSPDIYQQILTRLPTDEKYQFIDHPDAVLPDGTKTRKLLDLTEKTIQTLNPDDQDFWRQMYEVFVSSALRDIIFLKFQARMQERFGRDNPELVTVPIFYCDYPGYRIGVHTDAPFKVATMQFYFPRDNSQIHLGTSFHTKQGNEFPILKTNPFKPNSAYAFARTETSWHSVQQIAAHEAKRYSLALTIYLKGHEYTSTK